MLNRPGLYLERLDDRTLLSVVPGANVVPPVLLADGREVPVQCPVAETPEAAGSRIVPEALVGIPVTSPVHAPPGAPHQSESSAPVDLGQTAASIDQVAVRLDSTPVGLVGHNHLLDLIHSTRTNGAGTRGLLEREDTPAAWTHLAALLHPSALLDPGTEAVDLSVCDTVFAGLPTRPLRLDGLRLPLDRPAQADTEKNHPGERDLSVEQFQVDFFCAAGVLPVTRFETEVDVLAAPSSGRRLSRVDALCRDLADPRLDGSEPPAESLALQQDASSRETDEQAEPFHVPLVVSVAAGIDRALDRRESDTGSLALAAEGQPLSPLTQQVFAEARADLLRRAREVLGERRFLAFSAGLQTRPAACRPSTNSAAS